MKILAVSDLHFSLKQFDWLAERAPHYDMVIIAGDLLDIAGHLDLDSQITVVLKYLRAISGKTRLLVCSGNHDGDEKNENQEFIARWLLRARAEGMVVDGASVDVGDVKFSVCPWWDGPASLETMQKFLRQEAAKSPKVWLWVHHAPPNRTTVSWTGKEFAGDEALVAVINELQPAYVLSGHIHNSPFRNGGAWACQIGRTWAFNAGRQMGVPPAYIELNLATRSARWVSQAGDEEISLDAIEPAKTPGTA